MDFILTLHTTTAGCAGCGRLRSEWLVYRSKLLLGKLIRFEDMFLQQRGLARPY
jgi:hypothetical protein